LNAVRQLSVVITDRPYFIDKCVGVIDFFVVLYGALADDGVRSPIDAHGYSTAVGDRQRVVIDNCWRKTLKNWYHQDKDWQHSACYKDNLNNKVQ